ncbi:MAG: VOC family protein [Rhodothermales bacterium]|nr:VOC family protein [Rhodothermales bacterium]
MKIFGAAFLLAVCLSPTFGQSLTSDSIVIDDPTGQYIAVRVSDLAMSTHWYSTVFGATVIDETTAEDSTWSIINMSSDHVWIELIRDRRSSPPARRSLGFFKIGQMVPSVEMIATRYANAFGEKPHIIDDVRHGLQILQLRDPDDNILQFMSRTGR